MLEQHLHVASFKGGGDRFLGEVPVTALISGNALASAIGLTVGTAQFSNEPWLHFELDGQTLYVAKKPYRRSINWNALHAANVIYGGKTVVINGETYKVRLLKGSATDPHGGGVGWDTPGSYGSEWNRLFYPLIPNPTNSPSKPSGEGIVYGSWANYTEPDLVMVSTAGNGSFQWCQEVAATNAARRVLRGGGGVSGSGLVTASDVNAIYGWRPVLELVE